MYASQPFLIKPACQSRTVLGSKLNKPKASVMTKSAGFVVDTGLGIPVKSANMFTDISRVSMSPRSSTEETSTEEDLGLGLGLSLNSNRKRRLDYLTFEEKLKRKKLKNRVAAQTSRDRKKARMDELEAEVKELQEKNNLLEQDNFNLQMEKQKLALENQDLRKQLLNSSRTIASEKQAVGVGCSPLNIGPAVPVVDPLPQGRGLYPAPGLYDEQALWKILTFCIISQISLLTLENQTTLSTNLKNLQQVCFEKLMKTSKKTLYKQITRLLIDVENGSVPVKWWGRHQKTWNPVDQVTI